MLEVIEQERQDERWRLIHALERREAEYRAGVVAAAAISSFGAKKANDETFGPLDFFPHLDKPLHAPRVILDAHGEPLTTVQPDASHEMSTEATVAYLRRGFAQYVPENLRAVAGLA